jgi:subtilisin-like proprotein convertase family protein
MNKYLLFFFILFFSAQLNAQIFTASPNTTTADVAYNVYTLNVSGIASVSDLGFGFLEVTLNIAHANADELNIELVSPGGTGVNLVSSLSNSLPIGNVKFRLFANKSIKQINSGTINGTLMPTDIDIYNLINGQNPNGVWNLNVLDLISSGNALTINSWSIKFVSNPRDTCVYGFTSTLPLVKINTPSNSIPSSVKENGTLTLINNTLNNFGNAGIVYNIGVEKQGFTSASGPKYNMDIEVRNYNYNLDSMVNFLDFSPESDFIFKSAVTDEFLIKDPFTFEISRRMGYYAPNTRYVEMMVNGEYLGLYIMQEKVKRGNNRVNVNKLTTADITGGYMFEINPNGNSAAWYSPFLGYQGTSLTTGIEFKMVYPKPANITTPQLNYIKGFVDSFEYTMQDTPAFQNPVTGWRKWANEKSIINFIVVSEFSNNYDTYGRSMYFSKERADKGNKIKFGPPWDSDRGYGYPLDKWVHIQTHGFWGFPFWYQHLRNSDSLFNKRLACRYHTIRRYHLTNDVVNNLADSLYSLMVDAGHRNEFAFNAYFSPISVFKNILLDRLAWMDANLDSLTFAPPPLATNTITVGSTVNIFSNASYTYNFIPGPDSAAYPVIPVGNYVAEVTTNYGCQTRQAFTVLSLPLSMANINLTASNFKNSNYLQWNVANTQNLKNNFIVFKSTDAINYTAIATVPIDNNENFYFDKQANATCYYKIVATDINGSTIESNIASIKNNSYSNMPIIYPNPATNILNITDASASLFSITNTNGTKVYSGQVIDGTINISSLMPNNYLVKIITEDGNTYTVQFVKK